MNKPVIHENVSIGKNAQIGEFVIIGMPSRGKKEGEVKTVIGDNAVIRSGTVIYAGNIIGKNFQTGHNTLIREENNIGNDVSIGTHSVVEHHVQIQDGVRIHSQSFIPEFTILKKGAWIGPQVTITNAPFPKSLRAKEFLKGVTLEENAKIGANATILPGITIGKNALVGAGSVVTKNVEEGAVAVGNPAVKIKKVKDLKYPDDTLAYGKE